MISVKAANGGVLVHSPYSAEFVSFARMRGGKWSDGSRAWLFDERDEIAVRSALVDIYGTDDYERCAKCDIRLDVSKLPDSSSISVAGWVAVERTKFDRIRFPANAVLIDGGFAESGFRNKGGHLVKAQTGTIIEMRGIPVSAAKRAIEEHGAWIVGGSIQQLRDEREMLLKRLAEIEGLIEEMEVEPDDIIPDLADDYDEPPGGSGQ